MLIVVFKTCFNNLGESSVFIIKVLIFFLNLSGALLSVHVQTSDVVVKAPRNRKLFLLLAVAASAAPTLFI